MTTSVTRVPAVENYEKADDFLEQLSRARHVGPNDRWAFRGHGRADWPLVPSVLRQETGKPPAWEHKDLPGIEGSEPDWRRKNGEVKLVLQFRDLADRAGLAIPEDSSLMRSWRHIEKIVGASPRSAFGST